MDCGTLNDLSDTAALNKVNPVWDRCYSWIKCGEPLVVDNIHLIRGISTFIGAALLADNNDRCTA